MADDTVTVSRTGSKRAAKCQLLVELVGAQAYIIENKKTDSATTRDKEAAWVATTAEFNALSTVKRDHRQLKQVISNIVG